MGTWRKSGCNMASVVKQPGGRRMIQYKLNGKKQSFRLGVCSQKQAESVRVCVEDLLTCLRMPASPKGSTADWVSGLPDETRRQLERQGLLKPSRRVERLTYAEWVARFIKDRLGAKTNTLINYRYTEKLSSAFMGEKQLDEITAADAEGFRRYMKEQGFSEGNTRRRCKQVRQFLGAAVKARLIVENPFGDLKCGDYADESRWYFITRSEAQAVLAACPDAEWRLIFALCRYCGLRCPSEVLALRWGDVDWERGRFMVRSSKTEHHDGHGTRLVPIFPELLPYLRECFDAAAVGAMHVITRYQSGCNLGTQLTRIIRRAGLTPWEKRFNNLRSSCETELCQKWPEHYVTRWLGNSRRVAHKHYLQVPEDAYRLASGGDAKSEAFGVQEAKQRGAAANCVEVREDNGATATAVDSAGCAGACSLVQNGAGRGISTQYARQESNL